MNNVVVPTPKQEKSVRQDLKDVLRGKIDETLWTRDRSYFPGIEAYIGDFVDASVDQGDTIINDLLAWVDAQIVGINRSSQNDATQGALGAFNNMKSQLEALL